MVYQRVYCALLLFGCLLAAPAFGAPSTAAPRQNAAEPACTGEPFPYDFGPLALVYSIRERKNFAGEIEAVAAIYREYDKRHEPLGWLALDQFAHPYVYLKPEVPDRVWREFGLTRPKPGEGLFQIIKPGWLLPDRYRITHCAPPA